MFKSLILIFTLFTAALSVMADEIPPSSNRETNFCLDPQMAVDNEKLAQKSPEDPLIVKMVAIRIGLCELIAKGIIELDFAIDLFNHEHSKSVMQRIKEEQTQGWINGA